MYTGTFKNENQPLYYQANFYSNMVAIVNIV